MYYVKYVKDCVSKIRSFDTEAEATKFVANFKLKHQFSNDDDNWVDLIFKGTIIYNEPTTPVMGK